MKIHTLIAALATAFTAAASAQTPVTTPLNTGTDDLRGGNRAFLQFIFVDGTFTSEQLLSSGLPSRSEVSDTIWFPETFRLEEVGTIRIRHDGNPRDGHPFDTPDHWDLARLRIRGLYDSRSEAGSTFVAQFGPSRTQLNITVRAGGPDFTVRDIERVGGAGFAVRVENIGAATGRVTGLVCASTTRSESLPLSALVSAGGLRRFVVPLTGVGPIRGVPRRSITCSVSGISLDGRPEAVTYNNSKTQTFDVSPSRR